MVERLLSFRGACAEPATRRIATLSHTPVISVRSSPVCPPVQKEAVLAFSPCWDALYGSFAVDGLLYSSRLTSAECVAVYDPAVGIKIQATPAANLIRHPGLIPALRSIGVTIRKAQ
jgi:hypothetical protein